MLSSHKHQTLLPKIAPALSICLHTKFECIYLESSNAVTDIHLDKSTNAPLQWHLLNEAFKIMVAVWVAAGKHNNIILMDWSVVKFKAVICEVRVFPIDSSRSIPNVVATSQPDTLAILPFSIAVGYNPHPFIVQRMWLGLSSVYSLRNLIFENGVSALCWISLQNWTIGYSLENWRRFASTSRNYRNFSKF